VPHLIAYERPDLWEENVRIHLDTVEGLGAFIELEAVAAGSDLAREADQVLRLRESFGIADARYTHRRFGVLGGPGPGGPADRIGCSQQEIRPGALVLIGTMT
jgi:hypothetical protein